MKTKKLKILNLYAGIGGNRRLWGDKYEITAVENNAEIASVYKKHFPNDKVIIDDAHNYLFEHYKEFDFIWSSPPCQTHSSFRQNICVRYRNTKASFPDLRLYEEILFLNYNYKGFFVVENVRPYYKPLIKPTINLDRHLFWSNFPIIEAKFKRENIRTAQIPQLSRQHGFDLTKIKLKNKRQILRNCVLPEVGAHVFKCFLLANKKKK